MASPRIIRWGILATGEIAKTFARDLLLDPATRGVQGFRHAIVAASSSSSISRAKLFLEEVGAASASAYGSYNELAQDDNVDIIYVATPHSHHYQNVMMCLEAGKNVLCEKAFTVNSAQAKRLAEVARDKKCFLMEAFWTRYFPLTSYVLNTIVQGHIGNVKRVAADCSFATNPEETFKGGKHRLVNPALAGGALLDLGVYSLTWPFLAFYLAQSIETRKRPEVQAVMEKYAPDHLADETTTMLLKFPRAETARGDGHAISTASIRINSIAAADPTPPPAVRIQGTKGEIQLFPSAQRPTRTKVILSDGTVKDDQWPIPGPGEGSGWYNGFAGYANAEGEGQGMFWEADEAALALIEGRKEGRMTPLEESIAMMEVMDEVRRQGGLQYSDEIESVEYPIKLGRSA